MKMIDILLKYNPHYSVRLEIPLEKILDASVVLYRGEFFMYEHSSSVRIPTFNLIKMLNVDEPV